MTEPLKFFKVDHTTIYHDGFTYSFYRILDPPKSNADIQLQQSFRCVLKEEENCRSRCHVTGNWEMDKKGRKFMLGIVKKGDHTHGQEYRAMTESLKFFKLDDSTIYHDGFTYSFHRILDPAKSSPDQIQLQQSFQCALREEENCRSRCHVTGNWEMDKKGRKFMLGIVKKGDHTHGQEYRDTTPKLRFYKNNDESIHRNGVEYNLYRELDPPKQIADFQWHQTYRCALSDQENCRARIYTTGQWEENKRDLQYQLGIFKNCFHSHELDQDSKKDEKKKIGVKLIATSASSSTRAKDIDTKEPIRFYKYRQTTVQHDGFVYSFNGKIKGHPLWKQLMWCGRQINGKHRCSGYIRTTGKWEEDDRGREYQLGIIVHGHDHEPYQISFQGKDNDDETPEAGLKFYRHIAGKVHRDGHVYCFKMKLKRSPPWKQRMICTRNSRKISCKDATWPSEKCESDQLERHYQLCKGAIWTTGEWETDKLGRQYQRGIPRQVHSHKAYEQFLNEDDTAFVGNGGPVDDN